MSGWVKACDLLPDSPRPVLAFVEYGGGSPRKVIVRASYARKFELEASADSDLVDDWADYDEERDEFFCPEGWYEQNEFEETHWSIHGTVTHWRPLPPGPEGA